MRRRIPFLLAASFLIVLAACSVLYTNFSFKMRECIEEDAPSFSVSGGTIAMTEVLNLSKVDFQKEGSRIKLYFRERSGCKRYDISISNLSRGEYTIEKYLIKYEEVGFFELAESRNITIV